MSSSRMEQVFYNCHSKVAHYVLRHTSHRLRSVVEHTVLGLAVCSFCVVILSHRSFVHREDIASISRGDDGMLINDVCDDVNNDNSTSIGGGYDGYLGFIGEGRGVSMYSIIMQILWSAYAWITSSKQPLSNAMGKKIPVSCLRSIPGFRVDADVNHILTTDRNSFAFTIHRGGDAKEQVISGMLPTNFTQQLQYCTIGPSNKLAGQRTSFFGFHTGDDHLKDCSHEVTSLLSRYGYLHNDTQLLPQSTAIDKQYSPIIYSYSHSQGLLRLQPALQHIHNVTTQFIIASSSDPNCFGESLSQNIIFKLVGPDTPILNWILGLPQHHAAIVKPRFVYHWKTKKELDLDVYDMDHYAFSSSKSSDHRSSGAYEVIQQTASSSSKFILPLAAINNIMTKVHKYPLYRLLRFLTFKLLVLLSTLLIFFLTTSLVSFTFQETQDRMLEFTLQLQNRVRHQQPIERLILGHLLENLVFVPIMIGMIFFLIEFYGGDKFLAFNVLSMVWICEVFSAISIRSAQGMHFFPRVFFLYFTLFHVYFFSCPIGFTYASLASTILFLFHTMIFFLNRYELPALHSGLITPQSPRRGSMGNGDANVNVVTPSMIQPATLPVIPRMPNNNSLQPPQIPRVSSLDDPVIGNSNMTAPTAPLSITTATIDFTPNSDQQTFLPQPYSNPMRSYFNAASTSLQSIRSLASMQSLSSSIADRTSPNLIFHGGYNFFSDNSGGGDDENSEDDSYIARVRSVED